MGKSKLLKCPFCGGEAELVYTTSSKPKPFVRCKFGSMMKPKCVGCQYPWEHHDEQEAIDAWNRRASDGIKTVD